MAQFNKLQLEAINAPLEQNIIVKAGAGSGKTKTLTEKVFKLLESKEIGLSNLLVLTFTNNAAFEMKERIIKLFKEKNDPLKDQIVSGQFLTFDSFYAALVKKYSSVLNIPRDFNLISEDIILIKKKEILGKILTRLYEENDSRLSELILNFGTRTDDNIYKIILELDHQFANFTNYEKEEFINNYKENYLNPALVDTALYDFFVRVGQELIRIPEEHIFASEELNLALNDYITSFKEIIFVQPLFYESVFSPFEPDIKSSKEDNVILRKINKKINDLKKKTDAIPNVEKSLEILNKLYPSIKFIFEILEELNLILEDYKKEIASYTFKDISLKAFELLVNPKYSKEKAEITETYKYIFIDEYQDTNDIQEEFIRLLASKATLFVVGDVKQSIYRFRNANCKLFNQRVNRYKLYANPLYKVILMNYNYRSTEYILDDVNKFFKANMKINMGDVDYNEDEYLLYDREVNLYDKTKLNPNGEYGFNYLTTSKLEKASDHAVEKEILMIISDIKEKMASSYQVFDLKTQSLRKVEYSDFAILTRRRGSFKLIKKYFDFYNIPLNIDFEDNVRETVSIMVIESILRYFAHLKGIRGNLKHLYASIARSYIFNYNDEEIYNEIKNNTYKGSKCLMVLKAFYEENKNKPFGELFLKMVSEFGIITKLNTLGNIENNINKIESIYQKIEFYETTGEGLEGYIYYLDNLSLYKQESKEKSVVYYKGAVDLMTMHSSKGLEKTIVYIALSDNHYKLKHNDNIITLSKEYGIILPYNHLNEPIKTALTCAVDYMEEADAYSEFVRLIYVALTRAKESLYFVDAKNDLKNPLHKMLDETYDKYYQASKENIYALNIDEKSKEAYFNLFNMLGPLRGINIESLKLKNHFEKDIDFDLFQKENSFIFNESDEENLYLEIEKQYKKIKHYFNDEFAHLAISKTIDLYFSLISSKLRKPNKLVGALYINHYYDLNTKMIDENSLNLEKNTQESLIYDFKVNNEAMSETNVIKRASKMISEDEVDESLLLKGTRMHEIFEVLDFKTYDTSFIEDRSEKEMIEKVISLPLFQSFKKDLVYKEYSYLTPASQKGFIDLLVIKEKEILIIDYKLSNIDKSEYIHQLKTYHQVIASLFPNKKIKTYLLSLLKAEIKEIIF